MRAINNLFQKKNVFLQKSMLMPTPIERRIWIMKTVHREKKITMAELNRLYSIEFDGEERIPPSTFKRDIFEIGRSFNIYIEGVRQRQSSYYYMVNPHDFDNGSLGRMMVDKIQETIQISSALRDSEELGNTNFGDRIQLEKNPSGELHLSNVIKSIKDNIVIRFIYQGFWDADEEYVLLRPYFVKMAQRRWYVIGLRDDTGNMVSFCLDRIGQLALTPDHFTIPKDFDFKAYFKHSFGALIEKDIDVETVRIKVWGEQVKYLRSLPIHPSQKEIKEEAGYSVFQFHLRPTYDFKMEILSHGSSWEVLQPKWFRQDVASGFRMGYRLYYVDGRENKSEECQQMRELLRSWIPHISNYANGNSVVFIEDINNAREPQLMLQVKDVFSVIIGYNDMDKLYYGIRYEKGAETKVIGQCFDSASIKDILPLHSDGWYGWQKVNPENGIQEVTKLLVLLKSYYNI